MEGFSVLLVLTVLRIYMRYIGINNGFVYG